MTASAADAATVVAAHLFDRGDGDDGSDAVDDDNGNHRSYDVAVAVAAAAGGTAAMRVAAGVADAAGAYLLLRSLRRCSTRAAAGVGGGALLDHRLFSA